MFYVYDIECYPNVFTIGILCVETGKYKTYEISERKNEYKPLIRTLYNLQKKRAVMVGFNNLGYDYPVIHYIINQCNDDSTAKRITRTAFKKTQDIIVYTSFNDRFKHMIWSNKQIVMQLDLFKIHHFDNSARATSLKMLEFNMRSESIQELPYVPGKPLSIDQIDPLIKYMGHDIQQTLKFLNLSMDKINFRDHLSAKYGKDFTNHNDGKIGQDFIVMALENQLGEGICYSKDEVTGRKKPKQTLRKSISFKKIIFPYIKFKRPEFNLILEWLNNQTITETKKVLTELDEKSLGDLVHHSNLKKTKGKVKNLNTIVDGFKYVFGTGGIHGSVESCNVQSNDEYIIVDLDVTSYYPSLSIENGVYPEHLGIEFCGIYEGIKEQRAEHKKGTAENAMLKLALNKPYGDSNSKYSPFFDPQYTMTITINGQLLLCMLSESIMEIPSLKMIQANTDGVTVILKRDDLDELRDKCLVWELETGLNLEEAFYSKMFIRDVNNYLAVYENGNVKRKGAYEYNVDWHQNHSMLIVPKAVEAHLISGEDLEDFIEWHDDIYDFFLRAKVNRNCKLLARNEGYDDIEMQKITRYYVSKSGPCLIKLMPPSDGGPIITSEENNKRHIEALDAKDKVGLLTKELKQIKKTGDESSVKEIALRLESSKNILKRRRRMTNREISINKGSQVVDCNVVPDEFPTDINYGFYINEARKMIQPLLKPFEL